MSAEGQDADLDPRFDANFMPVVPMFFGGEPVGSSHGQFCRYGYGDPLAPSTRAALDPGIGHEVEVLNAHGVETFESCEGGPGHSYPEPTVVFHGGPGEGFRAFAVARMMGLAVSELRRVWRVNHGELEGPFWNLTFRGGED